MVRVDRAVTIGDLRRMAQRRLPLPVFDTLDGAAGDEVTHRRNLEGFAEIGFRPRYLVDVRTRSLGVSLFGESLSMPVLLAPTGAGRVANRCAELAVARAAGRAEIAYVQSSVTGYPLEDVAAAASRPLWFQMYMPHSREETLSLLGRVKNAGYRVLVVTIDMPVFGNRERDMRHRTTVPMKITPSLALQGAVRPAWAIEFLRGNLVDSSTIRRPGKRMYTLSSTADQILSTRWPVAADDLRFVRDNWQGPLVIKGVAATGTAETLLSVGVDGVIVSNHGGRQLDGLPGSIEVLPEIVAEYAGRASILLDGGVRRGNDVLKALALGADAVLVGRPYLYGLAAGGEAGVDRVLEIFRNEIDRAMALVGVTSIADIDADLVRVLPPLEGARRT